MPIPLRKKFYLIKTGLMDCPEELYLALLEYFEPEADEFSEEYTEDDSFV